MTEKTDTPPIEKDVKPRKAKKKVDNAKEGGVGLGTVIACSAVASLLGITGGAWLSHTIADPASQIQAEISLDDLDSLKASLKTLQGRTAELEKTQSGLLDRQRQEHETAANELVDLETSSNLTELGEGLMPLFEDIENRLEALENSPVSTDLGQAPDDIELTDEDQSLEARANKNGEIDELSETVSNLESQITAQSKNQISKADLNALKKRLKMLEDEFQRAPVLIPPFPREAVMDVLTEKKDGSGSWMSRIIGDAIQTVDAETVMRLDRIEKFVEAGDVAAINKELTYLPKETKPITDGWLAIYNQGE